MLLSHFDLEKDPFPKIKEETPDDELMSEKETGAYIRRSLRKAGMKDQVFYAGAIRRIYSYSMGDPSLVNCICGFSMRRALYLKEKIIHEDMLADCLELLMESKPPETSPKDKRKHLRVEANFPGSYLVEGTDTGGILTVTNISRDGARLKVNRRRLLNVNDRIVIEFELKDGISSKVKTAAIVRNTFGFFAGCNYENFRSSVYGKYLETVLKDVSSEYLDSCGRNQG